MMENVNETAATVMLDKLIKIDKENKDHGFSSEYDKEKFIEHIKGMSVEELQIVANIIPIQLCYNRIGRELEKAKNFKKSVKESLALLEQ